MEYRKFDELIPWEKNKEARQITDVNWEKLKADIKKRAVKDSFKIGQDNTVYDGNNRLRAVNYWIDQGVTNADNGKDLSQIPIEVYETPTEASKWELALTGNEQFASWNKEGLMNYLPEFETELELSLFNIEFDDPESIDEQLFIDDDEVTEDAPPPVNETEPAISQLGEVYQLGRHRLMCGDATTVRDVSQLMGSSFADILFTDPPYGYSYESNYQDKHEVLKNDNKILHFLEPALSFTVENAPFYIFGGWQTIDKWIEEVKTYGLQLKNMIIWKKNNWSMGDLEGAYAGQYEIILYASKGRVLLKGERDRDVWEFNREQQDDHPTKKPIELIAHALNNHDGNIVLDLFGGSGSTLIACEQTNRTCYMMELDPKYCDVVRKRYAKFINKEEEWQTETPKTQ